MKHSDILVTNAGRSPPCIMRSYGGTDIGRRRAGERGRLPLRRRARPLGRRRRHGRARRRRGREPGSRRHHLRHGEARQGDARARRTRSPTRTARAACRLLEGAVQAATYMRLRDGGARPRQDRHGHDHQRPDALRRLRRHRAGRRQPHLPGARGRRACSSPKITRSSPGSSSRASSPRRSQARQPQRNVITRAVGNRDYVQVDTSVWEAAPRRSLPALLATACTAT